MKQIEPYTDVERKCIAHKCEHFICWEYWGRELHSCELAGESDTIEEPANHPQCLIIEKTAPGEPGAAVIITEGDTCKKTRQR